MGEKRANGIKGGTEKWVWTIEIEVGRPWHRGGLSLS